MGTKRRVAIWWRREREYIVKAPGYDKRVDLVFAEKSQMLEWARGARMILRDGNRRRDSA